MFKIQTMTDSRVPKFCDMRSLDTVKSNAVRTTKWNWNKTVWKLFWNCLFQPKENAKTAVKRFSCFSQSQPVSAVYAELLSIML